MKLHVRIAQIFLGAICVYYFILGASAITLSLEIDALVSATIATTIFGMLTGVLPQFFALLTASGSGGPFVSITLSPLLPLFSLAAIILSLICFRAVRNFKKDTRALNWLYGVNIAHFGGVIWSIVTSYPRYDIALPSVIISIVMFFSIRTLGNFNKPSRFKDSRRVFGLACLSAFTVMAALINSRISSEHSYLTTGIESIKGWNASVSFVYRGEFYTDEANTGFAVDPSGEDGLVPSVWLLNARANYTVPQNIMPKADMTIFVSGENLTDELYITDREDGVKPGLGRAVMAGARFKW